MDNCHRQDNVGNGKDTLFEKCSKSWSKFFSPNYYYKIVTSINFQAFSTALNVFGQPQFK